MSYIPQHALPNLKRYRYRGLDRSLISRHVLNPFWTWVVTLWPLWVAPNVITLSGLLIVACNFLTLIYYDPAYLTNEDGVAIPGPPQWVYFTWAIGLFVYQTLDAIDGKQARRIGMSSPLGQLFDHGCDAINTTMEVLLAARALNLGRSWWTVASQCTCLANFYLTTWEEYHTGQLYLGIFNGPTEGILMICALFLTTGFFGPSVWDCRISDIIKIDWPLVMSNIKLNELFMYLCAVGLAFNITVSYMNVLEARQTAHKSALQPLFTLLPFLSAVALQTVWLSHPTLSSSAIVYSPLLLPFLCAWGLQFAHQAGRVSLAHVTETSYPWWDWTCIWSIIGALDTSIPWLFNRPPIIQTSPLRTAVFVYITLALSFASYARFCILVTKDITSYLGIACFSAHKRDANGEWKELTPCGKKV